MNMICKFAQFSGQLCTGFCVNACCEIVRKYFNKRELFPEYPINEKKFSNISKRELMPSTH